MKIERSNNVHGLWKIPVRSMDLSLNTRVDEDRNPEELLVGKVISPPHLRPRRLWGINY